MPGSRERERERENTECLSSKNASSGARGGHEDECLCAQNFPFCVLAMVGLELGWAGRQGGKTRLVRLWGVWENMQRDSLGCCLFMPSIKLQALLMLLCNLPIIFDDCVLLHGFRVLCFPSPFPCHLVLRLPIWSY